MRIIDSHCHLDFKEFNEDFRQVLDRARNNSIIGMQTICTKVSEFENILSIANNEKNIWCSIGTHPHNTEHDVVTSEQIFNMSKNDKVIGIGETGLDYYYENSPKESQKHSFIQHIRISKKSGLPLIIHAREADQDIIDILMSENNDNDIKGVLHCFTATKDMAIKALDMDLYISFSGIITFKNADHIRECCKIIPKDRILIETDAPFLAPTPNRGKRNEPSYIVETLKTVAELKKIDIKEMAEITTNNFFNLFTKAVL